MIGEGRKSDSLEIVLGDMHSAAQNLLEGTQEDRKRCEESFNDTELSVETAVTLIKDKLDVKCLVCKRTAFEARRVY